MEITLVLTIFFRMHGRELTVYYGNRLSLFTMVGRVLTVYYGIRESWLLFAMVWEGVGSCLLWCG